MIVEGSFIRSLAAVFVQHILLPQRRLSLSLCVHWLVGCQHECSESYG